MAFKSDKQRKAFFARKDNIRSDVTPKFIDHRTLSIKDRKKAEAGLRKLIEKQRQKKKRFLSNEEFFAKIRRTRGGDTSDFPEK